MPVQKGHTNNPNGRPKMPRVVRDRFQGAASHVPEFMQAIMNDTSEKTADRIRAAEVILDRAYGKPTQHTELDANVKTSLVSILASLGDGSGADTGTDLASEPDALH